MLEIRWRYWAPVNDPSGKDKRKKKAVDTWCEGEAPSEANMLDDETGEPHAARCTLQATHAAKYKHTRTSCTLRARRLHATTLQAHARVALLIRGASCPAPGGGRV